MISWEDFDKIDLRAGTIVKSEFFEGARKSVTRLWIDFGPKWGIKKSNAQIAQHGFPNGAKLFE